MIICLNSAKSSFFFRTPIKKFAVQEIKFYVPNEIQTDSYLK